MSGQPAHSSWPNYSESAPALWQPPVFPPAAEQAVIKRIQRAKVFVFLREYRHELFNEAFQAARLRWFGSSTPTRRSF